jgi:hypothetical protein
MTTTCRNVPILNGENMSDRVEINDIFEEGESRIARGIVMWKVGERSISAERIVLARVS